MRSLLHDLPLIQDQDGIRVTDGAQAVRNDDLRTWKAAEVAFNHTFRHNIQSAGGFIEQE